MENKPFIVFLAVVTGFQIALFVLKITHLIDWDWGWILAPLWIPYALAIAGGCTLLIYVVLRDVAERKSKKHVR